MTKDQNELINWLSSNYEEWLISRALRIVDDIQTAKDVVQEAFWTACLRIDVLSTHSNPAGWMFVTVHNLAMREMNRAYRAKEKSFENMDLLGDLGVNLPIEHYFPQGLSDHERKLLLLRIETGLPFEEIAERFGIRADACRKQYSRAVAHCRLLMEQEDKEESKV